MAASILLLLSITYYKPAALFLSKAKKMKKVNVPACVGQHWFCLCFPLRRE